MQPIQVQRLGDHTLPLPARATSGSAGFDLRARTAGVIRPGEQAPVPTGFAWAIPEGWCGLLWPRSGLAVRSRIDRRAGLVDADYREELVAVLTNEGDEPFTFAPGDRIAQMAVVPFYAACTEETAQLPPAPSRLGGFGTTGVG